jgi:hypothetical protein
LVPPATTTAPATPTVRLTVPNEARQRDAARQVREVFGQKMDQAITPEQRRDLSATMLDTARHTEEPDGKFALMVEAENYGVLAGDVEAALAARDALRRAFDLGTWPAAGELFQRLERSATSPDNRRKLYAALIASADDAIEADQFASARQLGGQALGGARRLDDRDLSDRAASVLARVSACEAEQKRVAPAIAALATKPADPAANAAVGKYLCCFKRDWPRGLPMLARGDDAALKTLAEHELKTPSNSSDQLALADGWWAYSESQPPAIRSGVRLHAGMWYAQASSGVSGLSKLKADERSADYLKSVAPPAEVADSAPPRVAVQGFDGPAGMLRALPQNLFPPNITLWDDDYRVPVNDALHKTVVDQIGTFTITVDQIIRSGPAVLTTTSKTAPLGQFTARIRTSFDPDQAADWDDIHEGGVYVVAGRIRSARFTSTELYCFVTDCRILSTGPTAPPAAASGDGGKSGVSTLQDLAAVVPLQLMPESREEWRDRAASKPFVDAFQKAFRGKTVTCRITIARIFPLLGSSTTLLSSERVPVGSNHLVLQTNLPTTDPRLAGIQVGTTCIVSGPIGSFGWGPGGLTLTIHTPSRFLQQR